MPIGIKCQWAFLALLLFILVYAFPASAQNFQISPGKTCFQSVTGLNGMIGALGSITPGSGGTIATTTYANIPLNGGVGTGATANITVSGGGVTQVVILNPGLNYQVNDILTSNAIGVTGWSVPVNSISINSAVAGGTVGMYIPGTFTVKQTYQNAAGTILNTNPITLDSNGCAVIFGSGAYRQVLYDSLGNEIWDQVVYGYTSNPYWTSLAGGTGNGITVNDAAFSATDGQSISFVALNTNNGPTTITPSGTGVPIGVDKSTSAGPQALTGGEIVAGNLYTVTYYAASNIFIMSSCPLGPNGATSGDLISFNGNNGCVLQDTGIQASSLTSVPFPSLIKGLLPSGITGNSTTGAMSISAGSAVDSTDVKVLTTANSLSWAVSNGNAINGYQGGTTLPNSTTLHMFLCYGTAGIGSFASGSLTPTCPTNYNTYYRRVFSFFTSNTGSPVVFTAEEIYGGAMRAYSSSLVTDISATLTTANRTLYTMSVPQGIQVGWLGNVTSLTCGYMWVSSPDEPDITPGTGGTAGAFYDQSNQSTYVVASVRTRPVTTNTSGQIGVRCTSSSSGYGVTTGWEDFRRN